jgi:hypothetical protein
MAAITIQATVTDPDAPGCTPIPPTRLCAPAYRTPINKGETLTGPQAVLPPAQRLAFRHTPRIIVAQVRLSQCTDGLGQVHSAATLILAGRNTVKSSPFPVRSMMLAWLVLPVSALLAASASAQGVPLGTAGDFGVLAGSEVTNTGASIVCGFHRADRGHLSVDSNLQRRRQQ